MDWRTRVIMRLNELPQWASWAIFAELWYLWEQISAQERTTFDLNGRYFLQDLPKDDPSGNKLEFIDELKGCTNRDFVETLARATFWLNFYLSRGQLNAQLQEIITRSVLEHEDLFFLIRQSPLGPDVVAYRQRTAPTAVLYCCWHVIPARTASGLSVNVEWLGQGPQPVWDLTRTPQKKRRASPLLLPEGYENSAEYRVWRAESRDGECLHGPVEVRLTALVSGSDSRVNRIKDLQKKFEGRDAVICFPELSLDSTTHKRIAKVIKKKPSEVIDTKSVSLVCPGTYHVQDDNARWWNEAAIYDLNTGDRSLLQRKVVPFKDTSRGSLEVHEAISYSTNIEVRATSIGLVALMICRDFVDSDAGLMKQCKGFDVDIILVPSMGLTSTQSACHRTAEQYSRRHPFLVVFAMQTPPDMKNGKWTYSSEKLVRKVFKPGRRPKTRHSDKNRGVS